MKIPKLLIRKKLRASTARRSLGAAEMEYEEMAEPNMKLSRALLIVLVLHVVAVAGIIAFNAIKGRQGVMPPPTTQKPASQVSSQKVAVPPVTTTDPTSKPRDEMAPAKAVVKEERKAIAVKPAVENTPKPEGKKTYVISKGDTPVSIAKKFKITSAQLLAANDIEDEHKLKIGKKLIIPAPKQTKSKKSD